MQRLVLLHGKNVTKEESSIKNLPDLFTSFCLEKEMGARLGERALLFQGVRGKQDQKMIKTV
jgi:hypothetical protein